MDRDIVSERCKKCIPCSVNVVVRIWRVLAGQELVPQLMRRDEKCICKRAYWTCELDMVCHCCCDDIAWNEMVGPRLQVRVQQQHADMRNPVRLANLIQSVALHSHNSTGHDRKRIASAPWRKW